MVCEGHGAVSKGDRKTYEEQRYLIGTATGRWS